MSMENPWMKCITTLSLTPQSVSTDVLEKNTLYGNQW